MEYFKFEKDKDIALKKWNKSQYELADVVLSLTDNNINYGAKIYAVFTRPEILELIQYFSFNFKKVKDSLGICGDYVQRGSDVFSKDFNPERNLNVLTLSLFEMEKQAEMIYFGIFKELVEIINRHKRIS